MSEEAAGDVLLSDGAMAPDAGTAAGLAACGRAMRVVDGLISASAAGKIFECEIIIHSAGGRRQFCLTRIVS